MHSANAPSVFVVALVVVALLGCGENEKESQPQSPAPPSFVPATTVPADFLGKRGIETWSQWSASFEIGLYVNGKPATPKPPDAKHVDPFVKTVDGKNAELLISHRVSRWDSTRAMRVFSWRWTLAKVIEPGRLQIFHHSAGKEDRPATAADVPTILEQSPQIVDLR